MYVKLYLDFGLLWSPFRSYSWLLFLVCYSSYVTVVHFKFIQFLVQRLKLKSAPGRRTELELELCWTLNTSMRRSTGCPQVFLFSNVAKVYYIASSFNRLAVTLYLWGKLATIASDQSHWTTLPTRTRSSAGASVVHKGQMEIAYRSPSKRKDLGICSSWCVGQPSNCQIAR